MNNNNINDLGQFQFKQLIQINQDALSANFQLIHNLLSKLQNQQEEIRIKQEQQLTINSQLNNQISDLQLKTDYCKETQFLINPTNQTSQFETLINRFNILESLYINVPNQKEKKKYITQDIFYEKIKELNLNVDFSLAQSLSELKSLIQTNSNEIRQVDCQQIELSKQFQLFIDSQKNWQTDIVAQVNQSQQMLSSEYSSYFDQLQKSSTSENEKQQHQINLLQNQIQQFCQLQEKEIKNCKDLLKEKSRQGNKYIQGNNNEIYQGIKNIKLDFLSQIDSIEKELDIIKQENFKFQQQIETLLANQQQLCSEEEVKSIITKDFTQFSSKFYEKLNHLQSELKNNSVVQDQTDIETKISNQCNKLVDNLVKLMANKEETKKALIYLDEQIKYLEIKWDQLENQSLGAILKQQDKCVSCDKQIQKISGWGIFPPKLQISERFKNSQSRNDQQDRKKRVTTSRVDISQQSRSINVREQTSQRNRASYSQENLPNLLIKQLMNNTAYQ